MIHDFRLQQERSAIEANLKAISQLSQSISANVSAIGAADGGGGEAAETSGAAPYGAVQQARSTHRLFNGMCVSDFSAASVGAAMRAKLGYSLS